MFCLALFFLVRLTDEETSRQVQQNAGHHWNYQHWRGSLGIAHVFNLRGRTGEGSLRAKEAEMGSSCRSRDDGARRQQYVGIQCLGNGNDHRESNGANPPEVAGSHSQYGDNQKSSNREDLGTHSCLGSANDKLGHAQQTVDVPQHEGTSDNGEDPNHTFKTGHRGI